MDRIDQQQTQTNFVRVMPIWRQFSPKSVAYVRWLWIIVATLMIGGVTFPMLSTVADEAIYLPFVAGEQTIFYVSRLGNNSDGRSWASAWNELDQIDWRMIRPGARILLDGGEVEMRYASTLAVNVSGSATRPIRIELSTEEGRDGGVVIDGGRGATLPYCGQPTYAGDDDAAQAHGFLFDGASWVVVDGKKWRGISIRRHRRSGLYLERNTSNITMRNLEIFDNGAALKRSDGWFPSRPGVRLGGFGHTLDRLIVYDNGEDAIQSLWEDNNLADITISRSWLHNMRRHPTVNKSSNYCTHADGIQIYDGGLISGITVDESVIGPGLTNGIIFGQTVVNGNTWADVQDVTLRNTIFTKATDNAIYAYQDTASRNWVLENLTLDCTTTKYNCINIDTPQHNIRDTIIYGSQILLENGLDDFSNNCQWQADGFTLGDNVDPQFAAINGVDPLALGDYVMPVDSPCADKGASITSVQDLLGEEVGW